MAYDKSFVDTPAAYVGSCPDGYRGSGTHEYDGDDQPPMDGYRRTSSPNGVPEVLEDGNVGPMSGEPLGKDGEYK